MTTRNASRAGLGVRALAITVDLALVGLLIAAVGVLLTELTGGKVRLSNTIINAVTCTPEEKLPAELSLPNDFKAADVRRCTRSFLGVQHDWTLIVAEQAGSEASSAERRQIVVPLDSAGRVADPFYVDDLTLLVLVAYLFLFEWRFGATPGKRALGIRVQSPSGAPIDFCQAGRRTLVRMVPILASVAGAIYAGVYGDTVQITAVEPAIGDKFNIDLWPWDGTDDLALWGIDSLVMIAFALNYIITTARRSLPWHDRWAGTEAVSSSI